MTVIGIAGCTALIVTAFGLWDAIVESITYHNNRVAKETMQVILPKDSANTAGLNNVISSKADTFANIQTTNIVIKSKDGTDQVVTLTSAQDNDSLDIVRPLHNRLSGQKMSFSKRYEHDSNYTDPDNGRNYKVRYLDGGIVISEKLANITGLMPGDTAKFTKQSFTGNSSDVEFEFTVAGITECYFGHYAYVNFDEYKTKVDPNVTYNKFLLKTNDKEKDQQIMSDLKMLDDDVSITYNEDLTNTMRNTVESVKLVVIILIICAALLAFVVIYNLTNISISERMSELATLKVLGNTDKEVNAYVHRETLVLTVIGALVGLLLGSALVMVIVQSTETDMMMMGRDIKAFSYFISVVLTIVFTLIVIFVMRRKIKKINMIESLKSVE